MTLLRPEHVTITLTGAEIARLPHDTTGRFLRARLHKAHTRARRADIAEHDRLLHEMAIDDEIRRLNTAAAARYAAMLQGAA